MKLILASNNAKKLAELRALLAGLSLDIVSQTALGIDEADEPHHSFVENALAKARHAALASGCAAIADDSGLCVGVLGGAPGVTSAHYAGAVAVIAGEAREARRRRRTRPTTPRCWPRWTNDRPRAMPTAAATSSARWWPSAMPTTPSRWWRWAAGPARFWLRRAASRALATTP